MPRFLLPKRSTPHRVAAIALYRALLSRCTSAPLPDEHLSSLRNAIRQKFRRNRKMMSPYQLGLSFRAGYEALDHLDAASAGNTSSANFLTSFISTLPSGLKRPPPLHRPERPPHPSKKELACLPPERAVLRARPYKTVSGPRKVPILCSANGVPFLRLTKPQPPSLSRVIRHKLKKRIKRFDTKILLQNYWMPLAAQEDEWDELLRKNMGDGNVLLQNDRRKWVAAVQLAHEENEAKYQQELNRDMAIVRRMQQIVDQETELALAEGQEIVRGRKGRRKAKGKPK